LLTAIDLIHGVSMMASPGIRPPIASRLPRLQVRSIPTRPQRATAELCQHRQAIHVSPTPVIAANRRQTARLSPIHRNKPAAGLDHLHV